MLRAIAPMNGRMGAARSLQALAEALFIWAAVASLVAPLHGQDIHIRVLNARNGKPITKECLNVWVGPFRGAAMLAPTNNEGVIVLHLRGKVVVGEAVSPDPCSGRAVVGPRAVPGDLDGVTVAGGNYVVCQEYGRVVPGEPVTSNLVREVMPSYPIKKVLMSGVSAANTCGKFRAQARPGELVIFERPPTLWERLRE